MKLRTRHDLPSAARRSKLWRLMPLVGSVSLVLACSAPGGSQAVDGSDPSVGDGPAASPATPPAAPASGSPGGRRLDSDELVGLGELGLLPTLLQTFSTGVDCDFDDALSTCQ